ncbi:hypothetical protein E2C01_030712 [Portunus trituberculatus]|uniref:Uncharacterized protein n=1 Tax=Portunus trituberculatus TaxID=210409 RepID=A0A5B7EW09_PORTR|nr:hypothetical protein [Portunus trituberculatus]
MSPPRFDFLNCDGQIASVNTEQFLKDLLVPRRRCSDRKGLKGAERTLWRGSTAWREDPRHDQ